MKTAAKPKEKVSGGGFPTKSRPLAAALCAVGAKLHPLCDSGSGVINLFTEDNPYKKGKTGEETWWFESLSEQSGACWNLERAWKEEKADVEYDEILVEVRDVLTKHGHGELAMRLLAKYPEAMICLGKAAIGQFLGLTRRIENPKGNMPKIALKDSKGKRLIIDRYGSENLNRFRRSKGIHGGEHE